MTDNHLPDAPETFWYWVPPGFHLALHHRGAETGNYTLVHRPCDLDVAVWAYPVVPGDWRNALDAAHAHRCPADETLRCDHDWADIGIRKFELIVGVTADLSVAVCRRCGIPRAQLLPTEEPA